MKPVVERDAKEQAKFHTLRTVEKAATNARFNLVMAIMVRTTEEERERMFQQGQDLSWHLTVDWVAKEVNLTSRV